MHKLTRRAALGALASISAVGAAGAALAASPVPEAADTRPTPPAAAHEAAALDRIHILAAEIAELLGQHADGNCYVEIYATTRFARPVSIRRNDLPHGIRIA